MDGNNRNKGKRKMEEYDRPKGKMNMVEFNKKNIIGYVEFPFLCFFCGYKFRAMMPYVNHVTAAHPEAFQEYSCVRTIDGEAIGPVQSYSCHYCKVFENLEADIPLLFHCKQTFLWHLKRIHSDISWTAMNNQENKGEEEDWKAYINISDDDEEESVDQVMEDKDIADRVVEEKTDDQVMEEKKLDNQVEEEETDDQVMEEKKLDYQVVEEKTDDQVMEEKRLDDQGVEEIDDQVMEEKKLDDQVVEEKKIDKEVVEEKKIDDDEVVEEKKTDNEVAEEKEIDDEVVEQKEIGDQVMEKKKNDDEASKEHSESS